MGGWVKGWMDEWVGGWDERVGDVPRLCAFMSTNIGRFEGETENIEHTCLTLAENLPDGTQTMWFKSCMIKLTQKLHAVATSKEALLHALNITTSLLHICNVQPASHLQCSAAATCFES